MYVFEALYLTNHTARNPELADLLARHAVTAAFVGHSPHAWFRERFNRTNSGNGLYTMKVKAAFLGGWMEVKVTPHDVVAHAYSPLSTLCHSFDVVEHLEQASATPPYDFLNQVRVTGAGYSFEIGSTSDVTITAGSKVTLLPGFMAQPGAQFQSLLLVPPVSVEESFCQYPRSSRRSWEVQLSNSMTRRPILGRNETSRANGPNSLPISKTSSTATLSTGPDWSPSRRARRP